MRDRHELRMELCGRWRNLLLEDGLNFDAAAELINKFCPQFAVGLPDQLEQAIQSYTGSSGASRLIVPKRHVSRALAELVSIRSPDLAQEARSLHKACVAFHDRRRRSQEEQDAEGGLTKENDLEGSVFETSNAPEELFDALEEQTEVVNDRLAEPAIANLRDPRPAPKLLLSQPTIYEFCSALLDQDKGKEVGRRLWVTTLRSEFGVSYPDYIDYKNIELQSHSVVSYMEFWSLVFALVRDREKPWEVKHVLNITCNEDLKWVSGTLHHVKIDDSRKGNTNYEVRAYSTVDAPPTVSMILIADQHLILGLGDVSMLGSQCALYLNDSDSIAWAKNYFCGLWDTAPYSFKNLPKLHPDSGVAAVKSAITCASEKVKAMHETQSAQRRLRYRPLNQDIVTPLVAQIEEVVANLREGRGSFETTETLEEAAGE